MMFKKILGPLDGSELAAKVLSQVEELAKTCDAELNLITVGTELSDIAAAPAPEIFKEAAAHDQRAAQRYLEKVAADLGAKGLKVKTVYKVGMPAREIITYAEANSMDLIALATHGKGEVAWVMGSVAEKVVSHATVPVLLLRVIEFKPPLLKEEFFMGA
jgi:nucleotide-binding universal stress UspA family protein